MKPATKEDLFGCTYTSLLSATVPSKGEMVLLKLDVIDQ